MVHAMSERAGEVFTLAIDAEYEATKRNEAALIGAVKVGRIERESVPKACAR